MRSQTLRPLKHRNIGRVRRVSVLRLQHQSIPALAGLLFAETRLRGWGGRIRTSAFRIYSELSRPNSPYEWGGSWRWLKLLSPSAKSLGLRPFANAKFRILPPQPGSRLMRTCCRALRHLPISPGLVPSRLFSPTSMVVRSSLSPRLLDES
jgi:hypothetical protein